MAEHLLVTGASGYIGSRLVRRALAAGHAITVLGRAPDVRGLRSFPWRLGEPVPDAASAGFGGIGPVTAVIHLAHDFDTRSDAQGHSGGLNIEGSVAIARACREAGCRRFVFASSQSAAEDALNVYGRTKYAVEMALAGPGTVSARIGLVYGGEARGQYGLLRRLSLLAPVLPMLDPWRHVQPIHVDEVVDGLLRLASSDHEGWVGLAGPSPVPFGDVLRSLARQLGGRRLRLLPVSSRLALMACNLMASLPILPSVSCEKILGLAGTRPMDTAGHLESLGLSVLPIVDGLRRESAHRRALVAEGRVLGRYILGAPPPAVLLRRYVRSLTVAAEQDALALPWLAGLAPSALRFVDPLTVSPGLGRRVAVMCHLIETSPAGQAMLQRSRGARGLAMLLGSLVLELFAAPFRLLASRW